MTLSPLIQYLGSSSSVEIPNSYVHSLSPLFPFAHTSTLTQEMQEECAWAIGNLGTECDEFRKHLIAQGVVSGLMHVLTASTVNSAIATAAWALVVLMKAENRDVVAGQACELGLLQRLPKLLLKDVSVQSIFRAHFFTQRFLFVSMWICYVRCHGWHRMLLQCQSTQPQPCKLT